MGLEFSPSSPAPPQSRLSRKVRTPPAFPCPAGVPHSIRFPHSSRRECSVGRTWSRPSPLPRLLSTYLKKLHGKALHHVTSCFPSTAHSALTTAYTLPDWATHLNPPLPSFSIFYQLLQQKKSDLFCSDHRRATGGGVSVKCIGPFAK